VVIHEHGITPENIWNMDETGFRTGAEKSHYILTEHPEESHFLPLRITVGASQWSKPSQLQVELYQLCS
jgi:aromatic ring-opening dioxygenase catalytic subunit (LigB family)